MRCPACAATNPDSAAWCGQCYTSLRPPADERTAPAEERAPAAAPATPQAPRPPVGVGTTDTLTTPGFRRRGDELEWACPTCGTYSSIDVLTCDVCGTGFAERFGAPAPAAAPNWQTATALSAVAPGAGHLAVGRYGSGFARLLLFTGWLLGGTLLAGAGGGRPLLSAGPLLLGALVVWAASLVDLQRARRGEAELLTGRPLLWLVVGVVVLTMLGIFATVATVPRPAAGP